MNNVWPTLFFTEEATMVATLFMETIQLPCVHGLETGKKIVGGEACHLDLFYALLSFHGFNPKGFFS
jgi:hypothetical protein